MRFAITQSQPITHEPKLLISYSAHILEFWSSGSADGKFDGESMGLASVNECGLEATWRLLQGQTSVAT